MQPQRQLETLLAAGDINAVMAVVERHASDGTLSEPLAQWLVDQAPGWTAKGWFNALWRLYELLAPCLSDGYKFTHGLAYRAQIFGFDAKAQQFAMATLALRPGDPYAMLILCQLLMKHTGFVQGREYYECRFDARNPFDAQDWREFPAPRWRGEPLAGKYLYLWTEQGLGDVIMFAGFLPWLLAQHPAGVTLGVAPRMVPLLQRSFPTITVESNGRAYAQASAAILRRNPASHAFVTETGASMSDPGDGLFDYAGPLGDLMVHAMPDFIPALAQEKYLLADRALVAAFRAQTPSGIRRVGISWFSSNVQNGFVRSIPLENWHAILSTPNCRFFSLQHEVDAEVIQQFSIETGITITPPPFAVTEDIDRLAAWIASMDHVVTIDNSNVHLAGALGIPTTLLLPIGANFRWPVREDVGTLWYRHIHTLRQERHFDWQPVIEMAAARLAMAT